LVKIDSAHAHIVVAIAWHRATLLDENMAHVDERETYFLLERQPEIENRETLKQLWKNN
jgi:hypothetical protein